MTPGTHLQYDQKAEWTMAATSNCLIVRFAASKLKNMHVMAHGTGIRYAINGDCQFLSTMNEAANDNDVMLPFKIDTNLILPVAITADEVMRKRGSRTTTAITAGSSDVVCAGTESSQRQSKRSPHKNTGTVIMHVRGIQRRHASVITFVISLMSSDAKCLKIAGLKAMAGDPAMLVAAWATLRQRATAAEYPRPKKMFRQTSVALTVNVPVIRDDRSQPDSNAIFLIEFMRNF